MKATKIKAFQLQDGDIFYLDLKRTELNNDGLIGFDELLTGTDVIMIADDVSALCDGMVMVNGGHILHLIDEDEVFVIGKYSELIQSIKK